MEKSGIKNLETERAEYAFDCVKEANELDSAYLLDYIVSEIDKKSDEQKSALGLTRLNKKELKEKILLLESNETEDKLNKAVKKIQTEFSAQYKTNVRKLPMYIKTNGLASALSFALSKQSNKSWQLILAQLEKRIQQLPYLAKVDDTLKLEVNDADSKKFIYFILRLPSNHYRMLTTEILALSLWLCRLADGLIEGEEGG